MKNPAMRASYFALFAVSAIASGPVQPSNAETPMRLRTRIQPFHESNQWVKAYFDSSINNSKTAVIITDMWDKHWCTGATKRVEQIARKMEPVLARRGK
jgi:hypothetical protein